MNTNVEQKAGIQPTLDVAGPIAFRWNWRKFWVRREIIVQFASSSSSAAEQRESRKLTFRDAKWSFRAGGLHRRHRAYAIYDQGNQLQVGQLTVDQRHAGKTVGHLMDPLGKSRTASIVVLNAERAVSRVDPALKNQVLRCYFGGGTDDEAAKDRTIEVIVTAGEHNRMYLLHNDAPRTEVGKFSRAPVWGHEFEAICSAAAGVECAVVASIGIAAAAQTGRMWAKTA